MAGLDRSMSQRSASSIAFKDFRIKNSTRSKTTDSLSMIDDPPEYTDRGRWQSRIAKMIHSTLFECSMGAIVVTNIFVMVVQIDASVSENEELSSAPPWTEVFGWAVLFIFTMELLLRLYAFNWNFWMDAWNIFDFIIVSTDIVACLMIITLGKALPVTWLRVFRLAKLARVSKVLRVFPELRLLLASLLSAITAILWGASLLFVVLLAWAMAAVMFIHPLNKDISYINCERCPRAYSSVMHCMLTFWQTICAGDSWGRSTIPLVEKYPATAIFFIPLYLSVGMTVVSLILGMVVSVAQEAKDDIKKVDNAAVTAAKFEKQSNLLKLCKQMDTDHSGTISQDELLVAFEEPGEFRDSMALLGITRDDFDVVWALLDSENCGSVCYKRLVGRLYGMKTSDSQFTLAYLKYHVTLIRDVLTEIGNKMAHQAKQEKTEDRLQQIGKKQEELLQQLQEVLRSAPEKEQCGRTSDRVEIRSQVQVASCEASEREDCAQGSSASACEKGEMQEPLAQTSEVTKDEDPQTQQTDTKTSCEASEREDCAQGSSASAFEKGEMQEPLAQTSEVTKDEDPQTQQTDTKTCNNLHSSNATGSLVDETQSLLKKLCGDIDGLRLEFKDLLKDMFTDALEDFKRNNLLKDTLKDALEDFKHSMISEAPFVSVMERNSMTVAAYPDLLVVPDQTSACSLFPGCKKSQHHAAKDKDNAFC